MELHFLKTTWSDIILLKDNDYVALIDTGMENQFDSIKKYLNKININKISFILLTHFHKDHYGTISNIIKEYNVEKVFFKNYSGLDKTTASGIKADNNYRTEEMKKCENLKKTIKKYSKLIDVENIKTIKFGKYNLQLYNNTNSIKDIYEDINNKNTYHKILFNENQNSLAIFIKINNKNIFLGGDITDIASAHNKARYVNYKIASSINEEIDIYKVPHHGTNNCNIDKTLDIYKPKIAVITNSNNYLKNETTIYQDLKRINSEVKILLTENNNIVINIDENGKIEYKET